MPREILAQLCERLGDVETCRRDGRRGTPAGGRHARIALEVLIDTGRDGHPIGVSAVARPAGVHRSLIYRHSDLRTAVMTRAAQPPDSATGPHVSRQSLLADLANLTEGNTRLARHISQLERRLSEALGQDAWHATGLGAPGDIDALQQRVAHLEQQAADLTTQLAETSEDLDAVRATNRELTALLNSTSHRLER